MLESPDYFWEDDEWLHVYTRAAKYLEVERRCVDQNLKYLCETQSAGTLTENLKYLCET